MRTSTVSSAIRYPEKATNGVPGRFQQRGFHNLIHAFFSDGSQTATAKAHDLYAFYPKGNGLNHRQFFQQTAPDMPGYRADLPDVKALVVWGQNPCSTEANQLLVRKGIKNLDTLVITEIFLTETAEAERKSDGVTYFLPAASFAETTGTIANSGRWIQRRWAARDAVGNTRADYEILLRLIKALHDNGAIVAGTLARTCGRMPTTMEQSPDPTMDSAALWGRYFLGEWDGSGTVSLPGGTFSKTLVTTIADNVYREFGAPLHGVADPRGAAAGSKTWYGTMWIYSNAAAGAEPTGKDVKSRS
jgi:anaerobic selenocysteine-containing dehydrogenase